MNATLTREQILGTVASLKRTTVDIPEWGGEILIREFTGAERDQMESLLLRAQKLNDFKDVRAQAAATAIINEQGEQIFTKKDIVILSQLSAKALETVFKAATELSGMNPESKEGNVPTTTPTDMPGFD